jgi:hypothetical protein
MRLHDGSSERVADAGLAHGGRSRSSYQVERRCRRPPTDQLRGRDVVVEWWAGQADRRDVWKAGTARSRCMVWAASNASQPADDQQGPSSPLVPPGPGRWRQVLDGRDVPADPQLRAPEAAPALDVAPLQLAHVPVQSGRGSCRRCRGMVWPRSSPSRTAAPGDRVHSRGQPADVEQGDRVGRSFALIVLGRARRWSGRRGPSRCSGRRASPAPCRSPWPRSARPARGSGQRTPSAAPLATRWSRSPISCGRSAAWPASTSSTAAWPRMELIHRSKALGTPPRCTCPRVVTRMSRPAPLRAAGARARW